MRNYQALAALLVARDKDGRSSFLRILWGVEEHSSQEWKDVFQQAVTMISLHNHRTTRQYLEVFLAEMIVQDVDRAAREKVRENIWFVCFSCRFCIHERMVIKMPRFPTYTLPV